MTRPDSLGGPIDEPEPTPPDLGPRLDHLTLSYWDGALSADDVAELERLLTEWSDLRARFNDLTFQVFAVREISYRVSPAEPSRRPRVRRWVAALAAVAAAVLMGLFARYEPARPQTIAHVEQVVGNVRLIGPDGSERVAAANDPLVVGTTVAAADSESSAAIVWADGSRLVLSEAAAVTIDEVAGAKQVRLRDGSVALHVRPQPPGRPMRCVSPESVVEVVGTKLVFGRGDCQTQVSVLEGSVRAMSLDAAVSESVSAGQTVVVRADQPLRAAPRHPPPDTYRRSLFGWTGDRARGGPIPDRPPSGSPGAVRAVLNNEPKFADRYLVRCPFAYDEGLFAWHADTVYHVRLRVREAGIVYFNVNTRFADPTVSSGWVQHATRVPATELKPGEWQTFHFPAARFKQNVHGPAPDGTPRVAIVADFGTARVDLGLTVDEFWVTRGPE